ncbi:MAG: hypothetical protein AVDCRST_MAG49-2168, partial [uncultured Thermomicrobiales bacterium]
CRREPRTLVHSPAPPAGRACAGQPRPTMGYTFAPRRSPRTIRPDGTAALGNVGPV